MKCKNCGARINADAVCCPYCSYMNERAANRRYMGRLRELQSGMEKLYEQPEKTFKHEIFVTLLGTSAAIILAVMAGFLWDGFVRGTSALETHRLNQRVQEKIDWKEAYFPVLDELYEQQSYTELMEIYDNRYDMSSTQYIYEWKHYALLEALQEYRHVCELKKVIEESGRADSYQVENALEGGLQLLYGYRAVRQEDSQQIEELAQEAQHIMEEYLKLSEQDTRQIYEKVSADGYLSYAACREYAQELSEQLFVGEEGQ